LFTLDNLIQPNDDNNNNSNSSSNNKQMTWTIFHHWNQSLQKKMPEPCRQREIVALVPLMAYQALSRLWTITKMLTCRQRLTQPSIPLCSPLVKKMEIQCLHFEACLTRPMRATVQWMK
jgi:hypothetical protein